MDHLSGLPKELKFPYLESKKNCPVCETLTLHVRLKSRLYSEVGHDIDMRPKEVSWTHKKYKFPPPRLFYMRTCPVCRFTAGHPHFQEPTRDYGMTLQKFVKLLKPFLYEDETVLKLSLILGSDVDIYEPDYPQAFRQHALAIYLLGLLDDIVNKDALNLARYYMRTAWLFRDMEEDGDQQYQKEVREVISRVRPLWSGIPASEPHCLKMANIYYETSLKSSYALSSPMEETIIKMIIARNFMLLEEMVQARKYISSGWDTVRNHEIKMREEERRIARGMSRLSSRHIVEMNADTKRMSKHILDTQGIYDDLWREYEKKQIELAESLLEKIPDADVQKKVDLLEKCEIDARIIRLMFPRE